MFELLETSIDYVFNEFKLYRIMANNFRSGKLLNCLGFKREGVAQSYLKIAGVWQEHVLTSIINPVHSGI